VDDGTDQKEDGCMSNILGRNLTVTLFGESHGPAIGAVLDGVPGGVKIDMDLINKGMDFRRAAGALSTGRHEADEVHILSGVKDGYAQGTPITLVIENNNVHRHDYENLKDTARPGHADYTGYVHYNGYADLSGGGHFSGRLTAPITACGMIAEGMLKEKGIVIGSHISEIHGIKDDPFDPSKLKEQIEQVNGEHFAVLNAEAGEKMQACIRAARMDGDSVGGTLETCIYGLEAGVGDPEFDSLESLLSHAVFSVPAVKGIAFGEGFGFSSLYGSEANDAFIMKDGRVETSTNHNGGINGGISNGMPIVFTTVIKPTPSISKSQHTVNYVEKKEKELIIQGRHDPCILHRARIVVDAVSALTIADALMTRFGQAYFGGTE
jgi:chorismate synthase